LHTTFQQNKDCNNYISFTYLFHSKFVAYDLPAKQGLQPIFCHFVASLTPLLHTTFQQNKDCNDSLYRADNQEYSQKLHTTFQQNKDCNVTAVVAAKIDPAEMLHTTFQQNKDCNPAVSSVEP